MILAIIVLLALTLWTTPTPQAMAEENGWIATISPTQPTLTELPEILPNLNLPGIAFPQQIGYDANVGRNAGFARKQGGLP